MVSAMAYNFYPMLTILMVFLVIITRKDFGPMARAEKADPGNGKAAQRWCQTHGFR